MGYFDAGNRFQTNSIVTKLIIANVAIYAIQLLFKSYNVTEWGALHHYSSTLFYPHQIFTNMFMHDPGGFTHILFNMFCLYTFGTMLERVWGAKKFFSFYMICGVGAAIIMMLSIPFTVGQLVNSLQTSSALEGTKDELIKGYTEIYSCVGASGAIMGVEVAFAYLFPNTELMLMFIPVPIKAKYLIPVLLLIDLFGGFYRIAGDNIGHFAHLGGALIGFLLVLYWNKTNKKTFY
jgi:membrane associated rhomboid family serine protease